MAHTFARTISVIFLLLISLCTFTASAQDQVYTIGFGSTRENAPNLYVTDTTGSPSQLLLGGFALMSWSPDGTQFAYAAADGLVIANADGSNSQKIAANNPGVSLILVKWSPSGKQIAYFASNLDLYVINTDGSNPHAVATNHSTPDFDWSPDGTEIAYISKIREITIIQADGSSPRTIDMPFDEFYGVSWSHDNRLLFSARIPDNNESPATDYDLYAIGTDGNSPEQLTYDETDEMYGVWSPDNTSIVYKCGPVIRYPGKPIYDLCITDLISGNTQQLTTGDNIVSISWRPVPGKVTPAGSQAIIITSTPAPTPTADPNPLDVLQPNTDKTVSELLIYGDIVHATYDPLANNVSPWQFEGKKDDTITIELQGEHINFELIVRGEVMLSEGDDRQQTLNYFLPEDSTYQIYLGRTDYDTDPREYTLSITKTPSPLDALFANKEDYTKASTITAHSVIPNQTPVITSENAHQLSILTQYGGATLASYDAKGAWSPDGSWIAYSSDNGVVVVQPNALNDFRILKELSGKINDLSFSPDSKMLVAGGENPTLHVWDITTGTEKWQATGASAHIQGVAFSSDGKIIATTGDDNAVYLWDAQTGEKIKTLVTSDWTDPFNKVVFNRDNRYVAGVQTVSDLIGDRIVVWDAASGQIVNILQSSPDVQSNGSVINSIAFNKTDDNLAISARAMFFDGGDSDRGIIGIWNPESNSKVNRLRIIDTEDSQVQIDFNTASVNWMSDGQTLLISDFGHISFLRADLTNPLKRWSFAEEDGRTFDRVYAVSPDGGTLFGSKTDAQTGSTGIALYDSVTGNILSSQSIGLGEQKHVEFSPDGSLLAFNDNNGVRVVNLSTGASNKYTWDHGGRATDFDFSADNNRLAVNIIDNNDFNVLVFDVTTSKVLLTALDDLIANGFATFSIEMTADGNRVLVAGESGEAHWYDVNTGFPIALPRVNGVTVLLSPDEQTIIGAGTNQGGLVVFDAKTGNELAQNRDVENYHVQFSSDGKLLFGQGGAIYDATTAKQLKSPFTDLGDRMAPAPSGQVVAAVSSSSDQVLRVYDLTAQKDLTGPILQNAMEVAFSSDGRLLAVMRSDNVVLMAVSSSSVSSAASNVKPEVSFWRGDCILSTSSQAGDRLQDLLTANTGLCGGEIHWSPDASKFTIRDTIFSADGKLLLQIPFEGRPGSELSWSPDSKNVVYQQISDHGIVVTSAESYQPRVITSTNRDIAYISPNWSPVSNQIVIQANNLNNSDIVIINPDGGGLRFITNTPDNTESMPRWSPDASQIAFFESDTYPTEASQTKIDLINPDGTNRHVLKVYDSSNFIPNSLEWSPNGKHLLIGAFLNTKFVILVIDIASDETKTLADDLSSIITPTWSADSTYIAYSTFYTSQTTYLVNINDASKTKFAIDNVESLSFIPNRTSVITQASAPVTTSVTEIAATATLEIPSNSFATPSILTGQENLPVPSPTPVEIQSTDAEVNVNGGANLSCVDTLTSRLQIGQQGRVSDSTSNRIRKGSGAGFDEIGKIPPGGTFDVLDGPECADGYAWWKVNYNGLIGWTAEAAPDRYWLEPIDGAPGATNTSNDATNTFTCSVLANDGEANLRNGPGTNNAKVGTLSAGSSMEVIKQYQNTSGFVWYKLVNGYWVREDAIQLQGNCSGIPN